MHRTCLDPNVLKRFLAEELDESHEITVQEHLDGCPHCRQTLESVAGDATVWNQVREHLNREPLPLEADLPGGPGSAPVELEELKALLDHSDDPNMLGRIGVYEICGLIGKGTTGLVMKALESRLNRYVAIKLLSPTYKTNGSARNRFERESRAVAAVNHEHVVPIYAVDDHRGLPYLVMKYIPGPSLEQRIERDGPLASTEVTRIGLQVAQGLAAAHNQGIIHRDVKPANVILEDTVERAMVTDFGLARVADEASMTCSGTISGTPQYMSPEQARGETVDHRSDLFSLGSLLYAACTGRPPFRAENVFGVINRVCKSKPRPIRELNPGIDEWLVAFIDKLMEKAPEQRFQTADETSRWLQEELSYLQNPTGAARPERPWAPQAIAPSARGKKKLGLWVAAGLLGAGTLAYFQLRESSPSPANNSVATAGFGPLYAQGGSTPLERATDMGDGWTRRELTTESGVSTVFDKQTVQTFPAPPGGGLQIQLERGDVQVVSGNQDQIQVTLLRRVTAADIAMAEGILAGHKTEATLTDGKLIIRDGHGTGQLNPDTPSIEGVLYNIEVPAGYQPNIHTRRGSVFVGGLDQGAQIEAHGDIVIGKMSGKVKARANGGSIQMTSGNDEKADLLAIGGDIFVTGSAGGARARTSNGNVYFGKSAGSVYAQTSGGSIYVTDIGGEAGGHASSGNVHIQVTESPQGDSHFSAAGGGIYVNIAEDVSSTVYARGNLKSNLEFEVERPDDGRQPYYVGQRNGGGSLIQLSCSEGELLVESYQPEETPALDPVEAGSPATDKGNGTDSQVKAKGPSSSLSTGKSKGLGGSGLGGSGLGGSGLRGSGLGGSGLGGSGKGKRQTNQPLSPQAVAKTTGSPRAGALATVYLDNPDGQMDGYTLYLPVSYDTHEGTYPILVYLQGAYGVGGEVSDLNNWGLARLLRDESDLTIERNRLLLDNFIVVCPHINGGQYHDESALLDVVLKDLTTNFKGDPNRISVTGLSRGGHGSWGLPCKLPGRFAAIVPVGGNAEAVDDFDKLKDLAIWIAHNQSDGTVPYSGADEAAKAVESASGAQFLRATPSAIGQEDYMKAKRVFTSSASGTHDAWTELYTSVEFYRWLLAQKRE